MRFNTVDDIKKWVDHHPIRNRFPEWKQNVMYVDGNQYWGIERQLGTGKEVLKDLMEETGRKRRNLTVRNKMATVVSVWIGQFLERLAPNFTASPSTEDYSDIQKARIVEKMAKWFWSYHKFVWNLLPGLYWLLVTGNMIGEVSWDKKKSGEVYDDVKKRSVKKRGIGDVSFRCISPFVFYSDPAAREIEDGRFVIVKDAVPKDIIQERWGEDTPTVSIDTDESTPFRYYMDNQWTWSEVEEICLVYTTYERHGDTWTKKIWSGDMMVEEEELTVFPFMVAWQRDYGRNYGDNTLRDAVQPQRDLNKISSMAMDHAETLGSYYLYAQYGSTVEIEKIADGMISLLKGNGGEIKPIGGLPVSSAHQFLIQTLEREIQNSQGDYDTLRGSMPQGSTHIPGYIQRSVMENGISRMSTSLQLLEEFVKTVFMKIIHIAQEKYDVERFLRINGIENEAEVMEIKGDNLSCADISIDLGSGFPLSKMERFQLMLQMKQLGLVENNQKAMEFLGVPDIDRFFYIQRRDVLRARRENEFIYAFKKSEKNPKKAELLSEEEALSMAPQVDIDDDDDVHLAEHRSEKKTTKYELADPIIQQLMDAHIALHKENQMRKAKEDVMMSARIEEMKMEAQAALQEKAKSLTPPQPQQQQPQQAVDPQQAAMMEQQAMMAQQQAMADQEAQAGAMPPEGMVSPEQAAMMAQSGEITPEAQAVIEAMLQAQGGQQIPTPEEMILQQAQQGGM